MGKLSKFEVTYTDNTLVYTPGQMVTGVLTLENRETLSCRGKTDIYQKGQLVQSILTQIPGRY